jgi:hypothetical protein
MRHLSRSTGHLIKRHSEAKHNLFAEAGTAHRRVAYLDPRDGRYYNGLFATSVNCRRLRF